MAAGLVASLARPGGNVTGLSGLSTQLNTKRLEILKDAVPKLVRVGLLRLPRVAISQDLQLKELRAAAQALKLKLEEIETPADANGLESAFQTAKQKQVNAIMTTSTNPFFAERKRIVELAVKYRLPAIYPQKEFVEAGGLMFYGADYADLYRRAAVYVDKILKGAKPADLPVQQATKFEFVINLKAANQIGLTIPPRCLMRANKVIKESAGINRHGVADERAAQERSSAPFWLRVMRLRPQGAGEALTGVRTGQVWSSEITTSVCRPCLDTGKAI